MAYSILPQMEKVYDIFGTGGEIENN